MGNINIFGVFIMNTFKKMFGKLAKSRVAVMSALVAVIGLISTSQAQALDFVTYDSGSGAITWDMGVLVSPIVSALIAAVTGAAVIWVIIIGVKYLRRFMGGRA